VRFLKMDFQLVVRGCHFHALYTPEIVRTLGKASARRCSRTTTQRLRAILNQSSTRPGVLMQLSAEASARIRSANEGNELAEPTAQALELRDAMPLRDAIQSAPNGVRNKMCTNTIASSCVCSKKLEEELRYAASEASREGQATK
jgi:hypothetical protein